MNSIEILNKNKPFNSKLTVVEITGSKVNCVCDCGKNKTAYIIDFKSGHVKSCGCLMNAGDHCRKYTHYLPNLYSAWHAMIQRCYNEENCNYHAYGSKGITVCDEWRNDYQKFLDWSLTNGWKRGLQLDKDIKIPGNKIYGPNACSWVTPKENSNHRSNSVKVNFWGVEMTIAQFCDYTYFNAPALYRRMKSGILFEEAIIKPIRNYTNR